MKQAESTKMISKIIIKMEEPICEMQQVLNGCLATWMQSWGMMRWSVGGEYWQQLYAWVHVFITYAIWLSLWHPCRCAFSATCLFPSIPHYIFVYVCSLLDPFLSLSINLSFSSHFSIWFFFFLSPSCTYNISIALICLMRGGACCELGAELCEGCDSRWSLLKSVFRGWTIWLKDAVQDWTWDTFCKKHIAMVTRNQIASRAHSRSCEHPWYNCVMKTTPPLAPRVPIVLINLPF